MVYWMKTFEDLNEMQKYRVEEAIGTLNGYQSLELEEVEPEESVRYDRFRDDLEGTKVERGEMSEEDLNGYLKAGVLDRNENGDLEINSIWLPGHVEKLRNNNMLEHDFGKLYVAKNEELGVEKAVYGDENEYQSAMSHGGSLGFSFEGNVDREFKDRKSEKKIEEMIAEFVYESENVEELEDIDEKSEYIEEFNFREFLGKNNTISVKNPVSVDGGETNMTEDYESVEEVYVAATQDELFGKDEVVEGLDQVFPEDPDPKDRYLATMAGAAAASHEMDGVREVAEVTGEDADILVSAYESALTAFSVTESNATSAVSKYAEGLVEFEQTYMDHMEEAEGAFTAIAFSASEAEETIRESVDKIQNVSDGLEDLSSSSFSSAKGDAVMDRLDDLQAVAEMPDDELLEE